MNVPVLELCAVSLSARVAALDLSVAPGERVVLLGRNGVGKTSVLRLSAGLETPDAGVVRRRGRVGWVPQDPRGSLLPWRSVEGNLRLAAETSPERVPVREIAALVGLDEDVLGRLPGRLSGGQAQRAALARALCAAPDLLLLDEPFSALDHDREALGLALARWCEHRGAAAVLVTHDVGEARRFAHRALVLEGPPARWRDAPRRPLAREDAHDPGRAAP